MGTTPPPTTPPRPRASATQSTNTPFVRKKSTVHHRSEYEIQASRAAAVDDLGPRIPEAPYEFFRDNILPGLRPEFDVAGVVAKLKSAEHIDASGRWSGFPKDPEHDERNEQEVFDQLGAVINAIKTCGGVTSYALGADYSSTPNNTPRCDYVKKDNKPDAHMILTNRFKDEERCYWRDICAPAEFKCKDSLEDVRDDVAKICWDMHQVMHEDPRRRFVHAFTIENRTMRLWFASRSDIIVSEPFDFITKHEQLVHFFLSLLYADDDELGLDPTMVIFQAEDGKIPVYDIEVQSETPPLVYRTKALLDQDNACSLRGRGTRVWDVIQLVEGKEAPQNTGVLKDSWVDADRTREGVILENIRNGKMSADDRQVFEKSFLHLLAQSDVLVKGQADNTRDVIMRGASPPLDASFNLRVPEPRPVVKKSRVDASASKSTQAAVESDKIVKTIHGPSAQYPAKVRHRVVFKEKCTPLYKIQSLSAAFGHLSNLVMPLQVLHDAGWVHRDLSTGNVLVYNETETKLADLEYAKSLDDDSTHDVRTGTADFMAVEVDQGTYTFIEKTKRKKASGEAASKYAKWRAEKISGKTATKIPQENTPDVSIKERTQMVFRHNPLHDMESLWWIALDFLINRERSWLVGAASQLPRPAATEPTLSDAERKYARGVFYGRNERLMAISVNPEYLIQALESLPEPLAFIGTNLLKLRTTLTDRYVEVENSGEGPLGKGACDPEIYFTFGSTFEAIAAKLQEEGDARLRINRGQRTQVEQSTAEPGKQSGNQKRKSASRIPGSSKRSKTQR